MGQKCQQKVTHRSTCQGLSQELYAHSVTSSTRHPGEVGATMALLTAEEAGPRDAEQLAQRHTASEQRGRTGAPGAPPAVACFVEKLGHLRGLPAARLATHDDDGVLGHGLHNHLFFGQDRKLQAFFLQREEGSTRESGVPCRMAEGTKGLCSETM